MIIATDEVVVMRCNYTMPISEYTAYPWTNLGTSFWKPNKDLFCQHSYVDNTGQNLNEFAYLNFVSFSILRFSYGMSITSISNWYVL